jgi:hypothetical protein
MAFYLAASSRASFPVIGVIGIALRVQPLVLLEDSAQLVVW